jgi:hypothetical protein
MGEVIEVGKFQSCTICHKRQATLLCDMPIGRIKNLHWKLPNGLTDYDNSFKEYTKTCDKPICEKCSKEVNQGVHFCKICLSKLKD